MAFASVRLIPGVDSEKTPTLNEAGYSESALIRFKEGLAQKIGGWVKFYPFAVAGLTRALHPWQDLNETDRVAVGTTLSLSVITSGTDLLDITPQTLTTNFTPDFNTSIGSPNVAVTDAGIANVTAFDSVYFNTPVSVGGLILSGLYPIDLSLATTEYQIVASNTATSSVVAGGVVPQFETTINSSSVEVTFPDHGLIVGNTFNFAIPTIVGGVTIFGTYTVASVIDVNAFTISVDQSASSSATMSMNGGDVQIVYYIALGPGSSGSGYGVGEYGSGSYGTGSSSTAQVGLPITATDWTFDNWGDILLACPRNGGLYFWRPNGGFENAQLISQGPTFCGGLFVAMPAQILVAWGASSARTVGVDQDPLLIRWSDQLDFSNWTVSTTTQAGSFRIPNGSKIVGGLQGPQNALIWTDLDVWAMQYIGYPLVFGFNKIGASCGLISAHAAAQLGSFVCWMGKSNFFALAGGGATPIPCPVWDRVFQDLDMDNADKVCAAANTNFNEVGWFYPSLSGGKGVNDKYVKLNVVEGSWDYGDLDRSAWCDQSVVGNPIGSSSNGLIYQHEIGQDADGQPIEASFTTGYWQIADGAAISFVDWILPDMRWGLINGNQTASIKVTFFSRMYSGQEPVVHGPFTTVQATEYITTRIRGREIAMKVESNDIGSFWRLGRMRYRFSVDGRR